MMDVIQQDYLDIVEHSQSSKEKIADYINEGFEKGAWLAKKINDLKLPGVKGITYRVKPSFSIGAKVRLDREEWKNLPDFVGLTIVAPHSTFEYVPEALKGIHDLDFVSASSFTYDLNYRYLDYPVEIQLHDYESFAFKQFAECERWILGSDNIFSLLKNWKEEEEAFSNLMNSVEIKDLDRLLEENRYVKAFVKFLDLGRIVRGVGRFSIAYPSNGTNKPISANFEDGFECDSAFSLAFLTSNNYSWLLRFGILSEDETLRDLAFMAYKGAPNDVNICHIVELFKKLQH